MEFNLQIGLTGRKEILVGPEHTAQKLGSGGVDVLATPMMVALMEGAARDAVAPALPEGYTTVGTRLAVTHDAATPVGLRAWAEARLTQMDGRRLVFSVEAFDEREKIGSGTHERFIVSLKKFMEKAESKKQQAGK